MDTGEIVGWSGLVISILGVIYSAVNHKHIKSRCCGRVYDFSIDIENTNPENEEAEKKKEEEEKKKKDDEEKKIKEDEEKKKKDDDEKKKKEEEEKEKKKISYTPHVFKIQPLHF